MNISFKTVVLGTTAAIALAVASTAQAQQAGGDTVLNTVSVTDTVLRDPGATEGTGTYKGGPLTLGKTPTSFLELPQSASIITRQRIEDQNFTDIGDALRYTTGVQSFSVGGDYTNFSAQARGATADFQVNGINQLVDDRAAQLDLAMYDRIEVLRGPAGLFKGAGSAGATINMVRKYADSNTHYRGALTGGSFGTIRAEGDVTGALNESGSLRGRLVVAGENRGTHLTNSNNSKLFAYGTLGFDVTPDTVVNVGGAYQQANMDFFYGLPAFANGTLLNVPRNTSFTTDWAKGDLQTANAFGDVEHKFSNGGFIKAMLQYNHQSRVTKQLFSGGGLQPSGLMALGTNAEDIPTSNFAGDIYVSTPFSFWGQEHNILFGGDFAETSQTTFRQGATAPIPGVNVYTFDPASLAQPVYNTTFTNTVADTTSYGLYSQLRVKPISPLTLVAGARISWREQSTFNRMTGARTWGPDNSGQFTPYLAALYDITDNLTLYASQAEIFQPQTATTVAGVPLQPVIGRQYETGLKAELFDGTLNASAAYFNTTRANEALPDPVNPGFSVAAGKRRVEGFEAEVTGQILRGWEIAAGYTYNLTTLLVAPPTPFFVNYPSEHVFTLWTNYTFTEGPVAGFEVGGGLRAVSDFHTVSGGTRFAAPSYTVAAARLGYRITSNLRAAINVENLFDETYYNKVGNATANNYYGTPRTIMFTVRADH